MHTRNSLIERDCNAGMRLKKLRRRPLAQIHEITALNYYNRYFW